MNQSCQSLGYCCLFCVMRWHHRGAPSRVLVAAFADPVPVVSVVFPRTANANTSALIVEPRKKRAHHQWPLMVRPRVASMICGCHTYYTHHFDVLCITAYSLISLVSLIASQHQPPPYRRHHINTPRCSPTTPREPREPLGLRCLLCVTVGVAAVSHRSSFFIEREGARRPSERSRSVQLILLGWYNKTVGETG